MPVYRTALAFTLIAAYSTPNFLTLACPYLKGLIDGKSDGKSDGDGVLGGEKYHHRSEPVLAGRKLKKKSTKSSTSSSTCHSKFCFGRIVPKSEAAFTLPYPSLVQIGIPNVDPNLFNYIWKIRKAVVIMFLTVFN